MSHFTELKTKALVKNESDLIATLKGVFGEDAVEVHDDSQLLTGYDGAAQKRAHLIVRKNAVARTCKTHGWNDIGYERKKDGTYALHVDPADVPKTTQERIAQDYAERVASRKLKAQGYTLKRTVEQDGTIKLVAQKY